MNGLKRSFCGVKFLQEQVREKCDRILKIFVIHVIGGKPVLQSNVFRELYFPTL
jgi:hypothetical protein